MGPPAFVIYYSPALLFEHMARNNVVPMLCPMYRILWPPDSRLHFAMAAGRS